MRCPRSLADLIEDDLKWFGIDWDDGGSAGGDPWYQSCRTAIYDRYFDVLKDKGLLYPCFCSRAELHTGAGAAPFRRNIYLCGTCQH